MRESATALVGAGARLAYPELTAVADNYASHMPSRALVFMKVANKLPFKDDNILWNRG